MQVRVSHPYSSVYCIYMAGLVLKSCTVEGKLCATLLSSSENVEMYVSVLLG
jgi:hypothetical protein